MTEYTIVVFGADHVAVEPALRAANVRAWVLHQVPFSPPSGGLTFLAIGPEGGAELARWVDAHGLDGVTGIGLVGVTAPWCDSNRQACEKCGHERRPDGRCSGCTHHGFVYVPRTVGPLEPLRAVAERARRCAPLCPSCRSERVRPDTDDCKHFICACGHAFTPTPLRIVIAAAPDDGVCPCLDMGGPRIPWDDCGMCNGTGKVLSSADVAYELTGINADGSPDSGLPPQIDRGEVTVRSYETRAALTEYGLRAVIETLTR